MSPVRLRVFFQFLSLNYGVIHLLAKNQPIAGQGRRDVGQGRITRLKCVLLGFKVRFLECFLCEFVYFRLEGLILEILEWT